MRVLLTGGGGFLGKYVQEELKRNNIDYNIYEHTNNGDLKIHENLIEFIQNYKHIRKYNFTHLIHLAAKVGGIGANQTSPYDFIYDNLQMGLNVIDTARYYKFEKVVMVSTVCGYPAEPKTIPFIEEELWDGFPEKTNSAYSIAKKALTETLWSAYIQHNLNSTVLNLANLYGKNDNDNLETSHVIPAVIKKIKLAKNNNSRVKLWGDGGVSRDFLFVEDAASAIIKSLFINHEARFGINIGSGVEIRITELVKMICKHLDYQFNMIDWDLSKPNGQIRRVLNIDKARDILKWVPKTFIEEGIFKLINE